LRKPLPTSFLPLRSGETSVYFRQSDGLRSPPRGPGAFSRPFGRSRLAAGLSERTGPAMLTLHGPKTRLCDGLTRRGFLRVGALGVGAGCLTLADVLRADARAGASASRAK